MNVIYTPLEGGPKLVVDYFECSENYNLKSLKGAPHMVGTVFDVSYNNLESLEGGPRAVGFYYRAEGNPRLDLSDPHHTKDIEVGGYIRLTNSYEPSKPTTPANIKQGVEGLQDRILEYINGKLTNLAKESVITFKVLNRLEQIL